MKKYKLLGDFSAPSIGANRLHLKIGSIVELEGDYSAFGDLLEELPESQEVMKESFDKKFGKLCDCGAVS